MIAYKNKRIITQITQKNTIMKLEIIQNENSITGILEGRLDTAASQQFAADMMPLLEKGHQHIVLNCQKLEFLSSSRLSLFPSLSKATLPKPGDVTGIYPHTQERQILRVLL